MHLRSCFIIGLQVLTRDALAADLAACSTYANMFPPASTLRSMPLSLPNGSASVEPTPRWPVVGTLMGGRANPRQPFFPTTHRALPTTHNTQHTTTHNPQDTTHNTQCITHSTQNRKTEHTTHSLTHSLAHSLTPSLTPSLPHSLPRSLTHSLTHLCTWLIIIIINIIIDGFMMNSYIELFLNDDGLFRICYW